MSRNPRLLPALGLATAFFAGCVAMPRINDRIDLAPLPGETPVSASGSVVAQGTVIPKTAYTVVDTFSFEKDVARPFASEAAARLDLGDELRAVTAKAKGDAIVNLRLSLVSMDQRDYLKIAGLNMMTPYALSGGATIGLYGGYIVGYAVLNQSKSGYSPDLDKVASWGIGGAILGSSLVLLPYLAAKKLAQEGRIVYRYRIEGEVVRFR